MPAKGEDFAIKVVTKMPYGTVSFPAFVSVFTEHLESNLNARSLLHINIFIPTISFLQPSLPISLTQTANPFPANMTKLMQVQTYQNPSHC